MSDVTESSERALRALRDESGSSTSPLVSAKMERSPSPRLRPASPDVVCPICLGEVTNKAVTDSCLHSFCFTCLSEWSKVKPECPLCKQKFSIIYHTIKSMGDYQEYRLDTPPMELVPSVHPGLVDGIEQFDPHIFINVAVQRATRFGYRTTMGMNRNGRTPVMFWMPQGSEVSQRRVPQILRTSPHGNTAFAATSGSATRSASSSARTIRMSSADFRRNVYQQNLWVRASEGDRIRESNPEFYRLNPAQTHRLVPWLTRELSVLLDVPAPYYHEHACREILTWITMFPINSFDFKRSVQSYFGGKTDHFVHEFYHFAISPFDLPAYDDHSRYITSNAELESVASSDDLMLDNLASDSSFDPIQFRRPEVHNLFSYGYPDVPRRPFGSLRRTLEFIRPPLPRGGSVNEIIVVSSDDEPAAPLSDDSDSEVMIIGSLPPRHLRTPEIITLDDSGDDSDVIIIKPATPPLIEIVDGSDSCSQSPSLPSTSNGMAGSSSLQPDAALNQKRTARFFRPSYREYSSSSDDEFLPKKKSSKKKSPEKKRPTRSSSKRFKSSQYVDSTSSDSEDSDGLMKQESEEERRASRKKRQRSSDDDSQPELSPRDRLDESHVQVARRRDSKETKLSKKLDESKRGTSSSSSSSSSCPKCLTPKTRLRSTSSKAKSHVPKKKRSHSISSDSSGDYVCRSKRKSKCFDYNGHEESCSSLSLDVDIKYNPSQESSVLAPNPKALSKKAIILNKRKSEISFDQLAAAGPSKTSNGSDARKIMRQLLSASDTDQDDSMDNKECVAPYEGPGMSDSPNIKMRPLGDLVRQLPGISVYSSDTGSSILSMGQEYMPGLDAEGNNGPSSLNLLPQSNNNNNSSGDNPSGWDQGEVPTRPPRICSTSSSSSSNTASSSHSILNVTSVDPPTPDQSDESYPELTLNPAPSIVSGGEDVSAVASSPPNLRRFDDASSPFISLNHSPLQSDSSSPPSPSHASVTSPPRLKSIVLRVPSPSRRQPLYPPNSPSFSSSSDEDDDY